MIERIWHGWTTPENADEYERLLREEIIPSFDDKEIDGYRGFRLLRRSRPEEVEFVTIMRFRSIESVKQFAGEDYETAHVPQEARDVLIRFDDHAQHYELREQLDYWLRRLTGASMKVRHLARR
ncbi:antibiotic biosynthesis monooxygenase [Halobaculum halobium]